MTDNVMKEVEGLIAQFEAYAGSSNLPIDEWLQDAARHFTVAHQGLSPEDAARIWGKDEMGHVDTVEIIDEHGDDDPHTRALKR